MLEINDEKKQNKYPFGKRNKKERMLKLDVGEKTIYVDK